MSIQMVPRGGGLPYAPHRDITNNYHAVAYQAIIGLPEASRNYLIEEVCRVTGVTDEDLANSANAFVQAMLLCNDPEVKTPAECLEKAGFLAVPVAAQFVLAAKLGECTFALYFSCVRDARAAYAKPPNADEMLAAAKKFSLFVTKDTDEAMDGSKEKAI